jgi:hypothetical protein
MPWPAFVLWIRGSRVRRPVSRRGCWTGSGRRIVSRSVATQSLRGALPGFANRVLAMLAGLGLLRAVDVLTPQIARGLSERQYVEMRAIFARARSSATGADTVSVWDSMTRPRINGARSLGDLPLIVLSVTEQPLLGDTLKALQAELPTLSNNSVQSTISGATHEDLISNRTHAEAVAAAIRDVVAAARTGAHLVDVRHADHTTHDEETGYAVLER